MGVNAIVFFGKELAQDADFTAALLKFPEEVYMTA